MVPALEHAHRAPAAVLVRERAEPRPDRLEVLDVEVEAADRVVAVGIEPRRDEEQLGPLGREPLERALEGVHVLAGRRRGVPG